MALDQLIGAGMLFVATAVFVYYTTWTFVLPFVDEPHPLYAFFPAREWAINIPVMLLLLAITVVGTFIGTVMINSAEKERQKQAAKKTQ
ncbi:hypothetical protein TRVA0_014S01772 [Trichomonascus vanleenenianus]|uniref:uncharacterized protein n=1 Tax=Trichomonascus vanleenenianus TaxID=2268995 RepID=UPI003ECAC743